MFELVPVSRKANVLTQTKTVANHLGDFLATVYVGLRHFIHVTFS